MKNNLIINDNLPFNDEKLLQTTALLYLQDALKNQAYEQCNALIAQAKSVGVKQSEIKELITLVLTGKKTQDQNEGKLGKNRLRLLKEK